MIYETVILAAPEANEGQLDVIGSIVGNLVQEVGGEVLIKDVWGMRKLAQANAKGKTKGHYFYVLYQANSHFNQELNRRLKINENVMNSVVVRLGEDAEKEQLVKSYKSPFAPR